MPSEKTKLPFLLRAIGLALIIIGAVLTQHRAGDWFFRSEEFEPRFAPLLVALRIGAALAGFFIFALAGRRGRAVSARWTTMSEPSKLTLVTFVLVLAGFTVYVLSVLLKQNMVFIESISPYESKFKLLGFEINIVLDEMLTADFITCFFFAMAGTVSVSMYTLHRLGIAKGSEEGKDATRTMWLIFSAAFYYLALDEFFGIHEFIGHNFPLIDRISFTQHPDDAVILSYFFVAMVVLIRYRKYLMSFKPGLTLLVIGIFFHGVSALADPFLNSTFLEEGCEAIGMIFYFGAMSQYALNEILAIRRAREAHSPAGS